MEWAGSPDVERDAEALKEWRIQVTRLGAEGLPRTEHALAVLLRERMLDRTLMTSWLALMGAAQEDHRRLWPHTIKAEATPADDPGVVDVTALINDKAEALRLLAEVHGIANLRHGGVTGRLIGDVVAGRTLLDMVRFQREASRMLGVEIEFDSADAPASALVRVDYIGRR